MKASLVSTFVAAAMMLPATTGWAQTGKSENFVTVQPAGQWLASQFVGQPVTNQAGERVGDINDLLFDKSGQISTAVIGVGGFLGIGEKNVAIPFGSLSITADANGKRVLSVPLSGDRLRAAPDFKATERTVYMRANRERAGYQSSWIKAMMSAVCASMAPNMNWKGRFSDAPGRRSAMPSACARVKPRFSRF